MKNASKNKIIQVQQAGTEALKFWNALKEGSEGDNVKTEIPKLARQADNILKDKPEPAQVRLFPVIVLSFLFNSFFHYNKIIGKTRKKLW